KAHQTAWLLDSWVTEIDESDSRFGPMAIVAKTSVSASSIEGHTLAQGVSAIEESVRSRKVLRDYLEIDLDTTISFNGGG
ncbi:MAG: hypothetical protein AAFQ04_12985, partial [Pseudomonadota bacterium]